MIDERFCHIANAVRVALLDEVACTLRLVRFEYSENYITLYFYYDGRISEEDAESASCVETELIAIFGDDYTVTCHAVRLDYPHPLPKDKFVTFARREQFPQDVKKSSV